MRTLHQLGLIELVDETRVRGAVEHHYRAKARPTSATRLDEAAPMAKQAAVGSALQTLDEYARASAATAASTRDAALIRMSMKLDPEGLAAAGRGLQAPPRGGPAHRGRGRASASTAVRRTRGPEIDVGLVMMMFEAIALGEAIDGDDETPPPSSRAAPRPPTSPRRAGPDGTSRARPPADCAAWPGRPAGILHGVSEAPDAPAPATVSLRPPRHRVSRTAIRYWRVPGAQRLAA